MTAKSKPTLGLDWDGTVSAYPEACAMLAKGFGRCIVITLNDDITLEQAVKTLGCARIIVEACPYSRTDYTAWKVEMCRKHKVNLFVEDDPDIAESCEQAGIPTLLVAVHLHGVNNRKFRWQPKDSLASCKIGLVSFRCTNESQKLFALLH